MSTKTLVIKLLISIASVVLAYMMLTGFDIKIVKVNNINFVYPVPKTFKCETKEQTAVELRPVQERGLFTDRTKYYIRFENGDVIQIARSRTVAEYIDGKTYQVTTCEGFTPFVEEG